MPNASAAAVGSLMILSTSRPEILPASLVACLWASLKYAGTVTTACGTVRPRYASAVSFIFPSTKAPIWLGEYFSPCASIQASLVEGALTTLYGRCFMSFFVASSSKARPINRLAANTVFSGLVTAWRFAGMPTSRWPSEEKPTIDGVVRMPSLFSMTLGVLPSITATQEFVVPRSIPITSPFACRRAADTPRKPRRLAGHGAGPRRAPRATAAGRRAILDSDMAFAAPLGACAPPKFPREQMA
mmetsp:Transcript_78629/g.208688  ORF Transcript_78629/g.208688 Transcript_78629/m.208688 type:complete len:244 (+) Transcript_78629:213-944(+)